MNFIDILISLTVVGGAGFLWLLIRKANKENVKINEMKDTQEKRNEEIIQRSDRVIDRNKSFLQKFLNKG